MSVITAKQRIEREKGARAERRAILAEIRSLLKCYGKDLVLTNLAQSIAARDKHS